MPFIFHLATPTTTLLAIAIAYLIPTQTLANGSIPGPLLSRLTAHYYKVIVISGNMAPKSITSSQKYRPLHKAQPSSISISDPRGIWKVLSSSQFHKHPYYNILKFTGTDSLISTQDQAKTSMKCRMLGP
ncbi:hypothetical protein BX661DRAFT_223853 [Kickxella alabastrina]|uniref:uncharacterized protein n=1 Tax=Kickxella alabastrina TaxID=61397 RepID=UPI00221F8486|nr:uncharacterized protein BX661DRAFT_223853 [Kickxella alabastrina]KAI7829901.1 hypothetical protein BX661DRAFT_223853 [Kickxella alabastrina]